MKLLAVGDQHYSSDNIPSRRDNYPEVCLDKTTQSLEIGKDLKIDLLCLTGDFCHTKRLSISYLNKLIHLFKSYDYPKASVIGNHDIWYGKPETVERTPLGTMFTAGVFFPKPGEWTYETEDTIIFFIPYMADLMPLYISNPQNKKLVLVSHFFFGREEFKDNLPEDYTDKFDFIILGHDHDCFPIIEKNRAKIIRPGGLLRGTRHASNWSRRINIAYVDTVSGECKYIPLVYKPASDIFSKERLEREITVRNSKIVEDLSRKVTVNEVEDVLNILNSMDINEEVRENTKRWLTLGNII